MAKKMSKRMLTALQKSIKHWEENVAANNPGGATFGEWNCALCKIYSGRENCGVCPVAQAVARNYCAETPYYKATCAHDEWEDAHLGGDRANKARTVFRRAARKELKFLQSLLPA